MPSKWYPNRNVFDLVDDFRATVWYCTLCHGDGKLYQHQNRQYPWFDLIDPCPQCEGKGFRRMKTVRVIQNLL